MPSLELTDSEAQRLRALLDSELANIERYARATPEMHEGLHSLYRTSRLALRAVARKLERSKV
jgi:hypothetical protein